MSQLAKYAIEHADVDWPHLLSYWAWLLPREVTVWIMNRFGDLFLVLGDSSVHVLDVGMGSLRRVADDRDDFAVRIDEGDNANDWLMIPLVDKLVESGLLLRPGECYSYLELPILGGDYTVKEHPCSPDSTALQGLWAHTREAEGSSGWDVR